MLNWQNTSDHVKRNKFMSWRWFWPANNIYMQISVMFEKCSRNFNDLKQVWQLKWIVYLMGQKAIYCPKFKIYGSLWKEESFWNIGSFVPQSYQTFWYQNQFNFLLSKIIGLHLGTVAICTLILKAIISPYQKHKLICAPIFCHITSWNL